MVSYNCGKRLDQVSVSDSTVLTPFNELIRFYSQINGADVVDGTL